MSSTGDSTEEPATDIERFAELNSDFQQQAEEAGDAVELMAAAQSFLEGVVEIDPGPMIEEQAVEIVAEHTDRTKKATTRELSKTKSRREREEQDRPEITELIRDDVVRVEALASTETDGDVRFRFVFVGGGSVVVDQEALWSSAGVRRAFATEYGRVPVFDSDRFDDWEDVVDSLFEDLLEWKADAVGPRQSVINKVGELVEKHAAYTEIERAYETSGVWVPERDSDVVYVESSRIASRAEEKDETLEAVRWEFDDQGLRVGGSEQKRVGGNRHSWWPLDREYFEPKRVEAPDDEEGDGEGGGAP